MTPDRPPMVNIVTRPMANSIGVVNLSLPHIVASQFRIFTPVGTAMNIVDSNAATESGPMPEANIGAPTRPSP